jgi:DNA mismatch endonuclease (patch repair protein)
LSADRSEIMRRVGRRDTKPEMLLRRALWARGLRYRLHAKDLPGTPDLVFRGARVAVFVHGCYWHLHEGCPRATTPKSNQEYWIPKFDANVARDRRKEAELRERGWTVVTVWECETENAETLDRRVGDVERLVRQA